MPRFFVPDPDDQEALLNERNLYSPGGAARVLGISRQSVHDSGERPGGRLLQWAFGVERGGRQKVHETYIDFGRRRLTQPNPRPEWATEWQGHARSTPDCSCINDDEHAQVVAQRPQQLLEEAREAHRLVLQGMRQEELPL